MGLTCATCKFMLPEQTAALVWTERVARLESYHGMSKQQAEMVAERCPELFGTVPSDTWGTCTHNPFLRDVRLQFQYMLCDKHKKSDKK